MSKTVWLITGAGRGMGTDIAEAALAAGHAVVATGRDPERVTAAIGSHDDLLAVKLDVTNPDDATAAAQATVDRFGRVDVLVNNAGNFIAGFFEEISPDDFRAQVETNLFGPLNVTRAVLPVMRQQRSGLVIAITSTGGIVGQEFCSAYSASKFGLEGWIESLAPEVAPFDIRTMVVEPGFFRTDLLTPDFFHVDCAITLQRLYCLFVLRPPRPDHSVADLSKERIRRRPVLGGLINEYERAA